MTDASPRFRSVLDTVPVYKPGRVPVSASGQTHKLSSNETPFAPLPSVVDAIAEAARSVHRYPDNGAQALIGAIADKFGVPAEHVAVLRTFSKAYGLAGLRTGFMIAPEPVAAAARTTMLPFSVNSIAQAAAIASLAAEDELFERVEHTVQERTRVREALVADGWAVPPTEANFVWLCLGEHTLDFAAVCFDEGIAIRPFAGDGARISIGDTEANDAFLAAAHAYPHRNA